MRLCEPVTEPTDLGDMAAHHAEMALSIALNTHTAIEGVLPRVFSGNLIICLDCGFEIPAARLRANPKAVRCIYCQSEHDGSAISERA